LAAVRSETPEPNGVTGSEAGLEDGWRAALRYAEKVTESGHTVTDTDYQVLSDHWDEGEIVEITMVIGLFNYFNRFNDALCVEVTR